MNRTLFYLMIACLLLLGGRVQGAPVPAQLMMGQGRSWQGRIVSRDGDWIEFSTGASAKTTRIGVSTIKQLNFKVNIDTKKLSAMMSEMDYAGAIASLEKSLAPFSEYSDLPSNLVRYNAILMELYYRNGQYDKSMALSRMMSRSDSDPAMQSKARVYTTLALISSGQEDEAKSLLVEFGWDQPSTRETAADELYIRAKLNLLSGQYIQALEDAAKVVAFHSQDQDWIQPAELLCAEIYTELDMLDSADEVCRQIMILYKNTPEAEEAAKLQERINALRAGQ